MKKPILLVSLTLAIVVVASFVRFPMGPLGSVVSPGPGHTMGVFPPSSERVIYVTADVRNSWPLPVALESVRPILRGAGGTAEVIGAQSYDNSKLGHEDQGLLLGSVDRLPSEWVGDFPVAGTVVAPYDEARHNGVVILVRITPVEGAETDVAGYEIDYALGPLHFRAVETLNSILLCARDTGDSAPSPACRPTP